MKPAVPTPAPPALEFPLEWHGRIIASDLDSIPADIQRALAAFGLQAEASRGRTSSKGRFVTHTVTVTFPDRHTMDQIVYALSKIPGVRMVL